MLSSEWSEWWQFNKDTDLKKNHFSSSFAVDNTTLLVGLKMDFVIKSRACLSLIVELMFIHPPGDRNSLPNTLVILSSIAYLEDFSS